MARIAVVEDDLQLLALLDELFTEQGWGLVPIPHVHDAHKVITAELPDGVILDIRLDGGVTGWQVLHDLKADPRTRSIPVILWSGDEHSLEEKATWLAEHQIPVLLKPFDIEDLYQTVTHVLAGAAVELQRE